MHLSPSFACVLVFPVSLAFAQGSSRPTSDRDKADLRGPVKTVVNEQSFSGGDGRPILVSTTTGYTPDGRILEERTRNMDGSEWVARYIYDADGRLLKTVTGNAGSGEMSETVYLYDQARRLVAVKADERIAVRYEYDEVGRRSATESYDSKPLPADTAYAPHWEGSDLGFVPSPGGKLATLYNEQGVATGARFYDAEGHLVGHIARKFDVQGHILAEEQLADAPRLDLPEELRSQLNPEQIKSVGALFSGMQNTAIYYSYDEQGRVIRRQRIGGVFGEQVTVTTYNDHGDKATESQIMAMRPDTGPWTLTETGAFVPSGKPNSPRPAQTYETDYAYQYDQYGNWTELTVMGRSHPDEAYRPGTVMHRKLIYY